MSGRVAKLERKVARLTEGIAQAHDRLHKDDVDGCHEMIHRTLGTGPLTSDVKPLAHTAEFDAEFRRLCERTGARASYVVEDPKQPGRLISGGEAAMDRLVTSALRDAIERMEQT